MSSAAASAAACAAVLLAVTSLSRMATCSASLLLFLVRTQHVPCRDFRHRATDATLTHEVQPSKRSWHISDCPAVIGGAHASSHGASSVTEADRGPAPTLPQCSKGSTQGTCCEIVRSDDIRADCPAWSALACAGDAHLASCPAGLQLRLNQVQARLVQALLQRADLRRGICCVSFGASIL